MRSLPATNPSPSRISARSTVGAVNSVATLCRSTTCHNRLASGQVGTPSYISVVTPFASGPYTM